MSPRLIGRIAGMRYIRMMPFLVMMLLLLPVISGLALFSPAPALADAAPASASPVMLANVYHEGVNLDEYWVSEKFDGVRGYWDGEKLLTRAGTPIQSPPWFTRGWPNEPLDGELWAGRGRFEVASATIRQQTPDDAAWRQIRFMVFDLPAHSEPFSERITALHAIVSTLNLPWVQMVVQSRVPDHATLQLMLERTIAHGGEGLMLHRGTSLYRAERNDDLLKFKPYDDVEAKVIAHLPGKGKYSGMMGALLVEMPGGLRFRLGTGFSDAQRRQPPPVGALVTYRYRGFHPGGIPRFASFMRVRDDLAVTP
ncbi:MAG: DNA ligase [bacterium]|nr:DNA ligase [bacterium]